MIEAVGSKAVTRRPVNLTRADLSASEEADDESIPCNRTPSPCPSGEDGTGIYQTPVALTPANWKKNKAMVFKLADDTAVESSESDHDIEVVEKEEMIQKKRQADKVRSHDLNSCRTSFMIDG